MGIFGDMIRLVRDTTKESLEECGFEDVKDELKDIWKALKGDWFMTHYIDKDALLAEIDKLKDEALECEDKSRWFLVAALKKRIESLEVKEVDLEKELSYDDYIRFFAEHPNFSDDWGFDEAWVFAEYFFKLGLKSQKGEWVRKTVRTAFSEEEKETVL